jgi:predicted O-methyltransferase YrrM
MRTSYSKVDLTYGDLLDSITFIINPKKIVEIGILDGYSLKYFVSNSDKNTIIKSYDLFEDFNGNHAYKDIIEKFKDHSNVSIHYGDFYKINKSIENNIDIIHIDIANNGDVFEYAIQNYLPKLSPNGILILEGGSYERDNIEWMNKYGKPKIQPILDKYKDSMQIKTVGVLPSITFIQNTISST